LELNHAHSMESSPDGGAMIGPKVAAFFNRAEVLNGRLYS